MTSLDDPHLELIQKLAGGEAPDFDVGHLVAQISESDPRLGLIARMLVQRSAPEAIPEGDISRSGDANAEADDAPLRSLRRRTLGELKELRVRNDMLAASLGACYLCWGDDAGCDHCGGRGAPGWRLPDVDLFRSIVDPAIRRLRAARMQRAGSRSPPPSDDPVRQGEENGSLHK